MLPRNHPDRIHVAFDDHRLVANAGLILPPLWPGTWACPGPGEHRRQDDDPGYVCAGWGRLH